MNRKTGSGKLAGMEGLRREGEGPVWLQIRRALSGRITSGAWPPGTRIPSEIDLTAHFGVSRMTTNRAIQSLALKDIWNATGGLARSSPTARRSAPRSKSGTCAKLSSAAASAIPISCSNG